MSEIRIKAEKGTEWLEEIRELLCTALSSLGTLTIILESEEGDCRIIVTLDVEQDKPADESVV